MSPDDNLPPPTWPPRRVARPSFAKRLRRARWVGITMALVAVGWAAWYFGIELPEEHEAAAAAKLRADNARTIPDLNLDLVWIAPGSFLMGTPEHNLFVKWFYAAREKLTKRLNPEAR